MTTRALGWIEVGGTEDEIPNGVDCAAPEATFLVDEPAFTAWVSDHVPAAYAFDFSEVDWASEQVLAATSDCRNGGYLAPSLDSLIQEEPGTFSATYALSRSDTDTSLITQQVTAAAMPSGPAQSVSAVLVVTD